MIPKEFYGKKVGVFVDDSNLYHAQKAAGWKIDWKKFKNFLEGYFSIVVLRYYLALPAEWDPNYLPTLQLIRKLRKNQIETVTKPLKYIKAERGERRYLTKGDLDVEIVLDVVRNIKRLEGVIIVSGDSDFLPLKEWILGEGKLVLFVGFKNNMAWELKRGKFLFFERIRNNVEKK